MAHHFPLISAWMAILADGCLAGLIALYVMLLGNQERTPAYSGLLMLLMAYLILSVVHSMLMIGGQASGMAFLTFLARIGLIAALVWSALHIRRRLATVRREVTDDFAKKLEKEFSERRKIEQDLAHLASFSEGELNPIIEVLRSGTLRYVNPAGWQTFPELKTLGLKHPLFDGFDAVVSMLRLEHHPQWTRLVQVADRLYRQQICASENGASFRLYMSDVTDLSMLEAAHRKLVYRLPTDWLAPLERAQRAVRRVLDQSASLPEALNQELKTASDELRSLVPVAQEWLEQAPLVNGRLDIRRQRVDAVELFQHAARFLDPIAQSRQVTLTVQSDPETIDLFVDRERLLAAATQTLQKWLEFAAAASTLKVSLSVTASQLRVQILCQPVANLDVNTDLGAFSRAVVDAHHGRWDVQRNARELIGTLLFPALTADEFFVERLRAMHGEAVTNQRSLSILRVSIPSETSVRETLGEDRSVAFFRYLHQQVSQSLRTTADLAIQSRQSIWLALPNTMPANAQTVADRLSHELAEYTAQHQVVLPKPLDVRLASYPIQGRSVESLLLVLGWFDDISSKVASTSPRREAA